ncbi:MAG: hypothetical protein LBC29_03720 [Propionibacteriaceae bacterium]|jgi:hypothetical protein|nr:hypothetical protein [Propionibacteriaceae bacterium]
MNAEVRRAKARVFDAMDIVDEVARYFASSGLSAEHRQGIELQARSAHGALNALVAYIHQVTSIEREVS